jgi:RimJ/RimL family protein N-acetyltransferase
MTEKKFGEPVIFLEGKRLYLRPHELKDVERCRKWINNPNIRPFLLLQFPISEAGERAWLESLNSVSNPSDIVFAIVLKRGDRLIGNTGIHRIDWLNRHAMTGAMIGEIDCQGKGYGSEAKELILRYCFNTLGLHRISSSVLANNPRSLAYLKKAGYREEGIQREHFFRNGQWVDEVLLSILEDEWRAGQKVQRRSKLVQKKRTR